MTATLTGVLIGTVSLTWRRTIIPDDIDGDAYLDRAIVPPGTTLIKIPRGSLPLLPNGQPSHFFADVGPLASQVFGQPITDKKRHVIVDANNVVVGAELADPILDLPPSVPTADMTDQLASAKLQVPVTPKGPFRYVQHDTATPGGTLVNGVFTAPVVKAIVAAPL